MHKGLATCLTLVRSETGVRLLVVAQAVVTREQLPTRVTLVGTLNEVGGDVHRKLFSLQEALAAHAAAVSFLLPAARPSRAVFIPLSLSTARLGRLRWLGCPLDLNRIS